MIERFMPLLEMLKGLIPQAVMDKADLLWRQVEPHLAGLQGKWDNFKQVGLVATLTALLTSALTSYGTVEVQNMLKARNSQTLYSKVVTKGELACGFEGVLSDADRAWWSAVSTRLNLPVVWVKMDAPESPIPGLGVLASLPLVGNVVAQAQSAVADMPCQPVPLHAGDNLTHRVVPVRTETARLLVRKADAAKPVEAMNTPLHVVPLVNDGGWLAEGLANTLPRATAVGLPLEVSETVALLEAGKLDAIPMAESEARAVVAKHSKLAFHNVPLATRTVGITLPMGEVELHTVLGQGVGK
ncbi:MAG: hypothetical protein WAZ18_02315 [Alphaproteobacteria bacterium]